MMVISFIQDQDVIQKIPKHLGLWFLKSNAPPKANVAYPPWRAPPVGHHIDYAETQFPSYDNYNIDPEYPLDTYAL
jgi:hypothetical protein